MTFALAGCLGAEEYVRPVAPVSAAWPDARSTDVPGNADQIPWRGFFTDARLQTLIEAALNHNRTVRVATARLDEARAQFGISRAEMLPMVNANLSQSGQGRSQELAGRGNPLISRRYDLGLGLVSYEVDLWGRLSSLSASAKANLLASESARRGVRLSLIGEVAGTYYGMLEAQERLQLARQALALHEKTLELVQIARGEGFASNLEKLGAEDAIETARTEIVQLERQLATARNKLDLLVGSVPDRLPEGRSLDSQNIDYGLAPGLPAETLLARPDVAEAEQRLLAAHANIDAARAAFLPKILLTAGFGLASHSLVSLLGGGQAAWNFQPSLSLPLFDGGRNQGNLDVATARKDLAVAEYEKALQEAFREVADLLATRKSLLEYRRGAEAQLAFGAERLKTVEARREAGFASALDVLGAQRELLTLRQTVLETKRAQLENAAQLYKAMGGGQALAGAGGDLEQASVQPGLVSALGAVAPHFE